MAFRAPVGEVAESYEQAACAEQVTYALCLLCHTVHRVWEPPKVEYSNGGVLFPLVTDTDRRKYCPPVEKPQ